MCAVGAAALAIWPGQWPAIGLMLIAALLAAWVVARRTLRHVRRRVHELRQAADAISGGDLDHSLQAVAGDDFIKLAGALDRLADQLRDTVDEQQRLRAQLTRSEKLALIGELAATVAHEINNPLDGLQNSVHILRRGLDDPEQREQLLSMMDGGLHRIEMIVRRLLTMSRDEPTRAESIALEQIVDEASVFVKPRLDRYGIALVNDRCDEPVMVLADACQMTQVLINLMLNAADAMPSGGKLVLRCRCGKARPEQKLDGDASAGTRVILEVSDTGIGIAPEHLDRIFEPFFTTKPSGKGTGLGLAVVARIVEAHGGSIEVRSEPGRGTRFHIELPAAPGAVSRPARGDRAAWHHAAKSAPSGASTN